MQFERLSERLLANAARAKPAERLFAEIRQHQYKVCTAPELPAPEVKNYIFENLLAEHTEQITAVIVTVQGTNYLYGEQSKDMRYVMLLNARLKEIAWIYYDASWRRVGVKGKLLSAGKYDYSVSYEVGKGYYRDLAPELRWDLADRASGGVPEALRYVGDEAVIQIMEERFFVYEKGGVAY